MRVGDGCWHRTAISHTLCGKKMLSYAPECRCDGASAHRESTIASSTPLTTELQDASTNANVSSLSCIVAHRQHGLLLGLATLGCSRSVWTRLEKVVGRDVDAKRFECWKNRS